MEFVKVTRTFTTRSKVPLTDYGEGLMTEGEAIAWEKAQTMEELYEGLIDDDSVEIKTEVEVVEEPDE